MARKIAPARGDCALRGFRGFRTLPAGLLQDYLAKEAFLSALSRGSRFRARYRRSRPCCPPSPPRLGRPFDGTPQVDEADLGFDPPRFFFPPAASMPWSPLFARSSGSAFGSCPMRSWIDGSWGRRRAGSGLDLGFAGTPCAALLVGERARSCVSPPAIPSTADPLRPPFLASRRTARVLCRSIRIARKTVLRSASGTLRDRASLRRSPQLPRFFAESPEGERVLALPAADSREASPDTAFADDGSRPAVFRIVPVSSRRGTGSSENFGKLSLWRRADLIGGTRLPRGTAVGCGLNAADLRPSLWRPAMAGGLECVASIGRRRSSFSSCPAGVAQGNPPPAFREGKTAAADESFDRAGLDGHLALDRRRIAPPASPRASTRRRKPRRRPSPAPPPPGGCR